MNSGAVDPMEVEAAAASGAGSSAPPAPVDLDVEGGLGGADGESAVAASADGGLGKVDDGEEEDGDFHATVIAGRVATSWKARVEAYHISRFRCGGRETFVLRHEAQRIEIRCGSVGKQKMTKDSCPFLYKGTAKGEMLADNKKLNGADKDKRKYLFNVVVALHTCPAPDQTKRAGGGRKRPQALPLGSNSLQPLLADSPASRGEQPSADQVRKIVGEKLGIGMEEMKKIAHPRTMLLYRAKRKMRDSLSSNGGTSGSNGGGSGTAGAGTDDSVDTLASLAAMEPPVQDHPSAALPTPPSGTDGMTAPTPAPPLAAPSSAGLEGVADTPAAAAMDLEAVDRPDADSTVDEAGTDLLSEMDLGGVSSPGRSDAMGTSEDSGESNSAISLPSKRHRDEDLELVDRAGAPRTVYVRVKRRKV